MPLTVGDNRLSAIDQVMKEDFRYGEVIRIVSIMTEHLKDNLTLSLLSGVVKEVIFFLPRYQGVDDGICISLCRDRLL